MPGDDNDAGSKGVSTAVTVLGMILLAVPLALWVAWSRAGFTIVLLTGLVSGILIVVLLCRQRSADVTEANADNDSSAILEDLVKELHAIFPLTYHHSLNGHARFRRAMEKLRQRL